MYENINKNNYTPMMRQYLEIKENYPDTLVFFRLGDFYEMFFNDALVASRELEIVLTSRDAGTNNDRVPMCGVPFHAVSGYIERLSERGYKVAIVEQLEEATKGKNIVKRDVIKIITPGTNIDENYLDEKSNNYLGSIDKINNNFVLAYIDISTGEAKITDFPSIELLYSELIKLNIKEVVIRRNFPKEICNYLTKLLSIIVSIHDETKIDDYLVSLTEEVVEEYIPLVNRLLSYVILTQKRVLVHLKKFDYYANNDYLKIDSGSVKSLELIESIRGGKNKNNLFVLLDKCSTSMGSRFLKKNILFPLVSVKEITFRQDLIEEFNKHYLAVTDLKKDLLNIYDLERIIGRISYGSLSPKDLVQLKRSLSVLPHIKLVLAGMKGKNANKYSTTIEEFSSLYNLLNNALNEEVPYLLRDGGVIKEGFNEELDKTRNINTSNKEFLVNLEKSERERTKIKSLKVGYNKVFGYYIEVTKANLSLVKDEFGYIRKQTTSNSERYITQELKEREALILRSDERALELEIEIFNNLREECKKCLEDLQRLADRISKLDMLISLSEVSKEHNYVRPVFSLYDELEIIGGRHPVMEAFNDYQFVDNDLKLYNNDKILLITGPNMSGKSTYMRQNALIIIMAQIGSFVPCKKCTLPLFDQIFTRIGASDDISGGESTFMTEMLEVNRALSNATDRSLILFDEVGRGTATFDGMALAQSIIEYIHDNIGCKTFFSTHYHELTHLEKSLPFLRNVHVEAEVEDDKIVFLHKVIDGATDKSYGINVANLAKLPIDITIRAQDLLNKLEVSKDVDTDLLSINNYQKPIIQIKEVNKHQDLIEEIKNLDIDSMRPIDALNTLMQLKQKVGD